MNLLSSLFPAIEFLFFGLFVYIAPDWFLNPEDGRVGFLSYVGKTSLETNHIDPINRFKMMTYGAGLVSIAVMQFLANNRLKKRSLLMTKFYNAILLWLVSVHTAKHLEDYPSLNPIAIGFAAGLHTVNVLWLTSEIVTYFRKGDDVPRTPAKPSHIFIVVFMIFYTGFFGLMDIFNPKIFAPGHAMAYYNKTPLEDDTLDDLSIFVSKLQGAVLLTFVFSMLELLILDRSVERIRWHSTFALVAGTLYLGTILRAVLDSSGYIKRSTYIRMIVFHCTAMGLTLGLGPNILEKTPDIMSKKADAPVPDLATEQHTKKLK